MDRQINILYTIETLRCDGAQRRLLNDLHYLDRNKFNPVLCAVFADNKDSFDFASLGVPVYCLNMSSPEHFLPAIAKLYAIIRKHRIDIIHSQLFFADILSRALKLLKPRIKLISTIQAPNYDPECKDIYSKKRLILDSISGRLLNDKFVAVSNFVREATIKRLGFSARRLSVIYNYVQEDTIPVFSQQQRDSLRKRLGIKPEQICILCTGRLVPAKGQQFLLEALALLIPEIPSLVAFFVGDGKSADSLLQLAVKLHIESKVYFLGVRQDIPELLAGADIFVLPTLNEGFSLALLEAMLSGKPCIASDIGPMREVIEAGISGILFEAGNSQALAQAIKALIADRQYATGIGSNARKAARENFSSRKFADKLQELYAEMVK